MTCVRCGKREASVFIRREGAGELALCGVCARDQGITEEDGRLQISLEDLFSPLRDAPDRPGYRASCPVCGTRLSEVRKTGRIGCPSCFEAFRPELVAFLQRRGRRGTYKGSVPRRFAVSDRGGGPGPENAETRTPPAEASEVPEGTEARKELEARLRQALAGEDYEQAARLRDLLRSMEGAAQ